MKKQTVALVAVVTGALSAWTLGAQGTSGTGQTTTGTAQGTTGAAQGAAVQTPAPTPAPMTAQKSEIVQKIIVKVNGEIFTQSQLEFRQIQALRDQNRPVGKAEDLNTDPGLRVALAEVTPLILLDAVDELMEVQHGRELGYKFTDLIFAKSVEDLKKTNNLDDKSFAAALKQEGLTLSDLRTNIEHAWFRSTVEQKELMRSMTLTEEEMRQYYNAHQDQFMKPATVTLREILVSVPADKVAGQVSFNASADENARQKIAAVRERALKGEDYLKLVAEVSESPTKAEGGLIGPINASDLSPTVSDMLDKMKPGDITEPLRTKAGYQIFKLDSRSASEAEPFEKSRDQIRQRILQSRQDVERTKFLDKLRIQAVIEWKDAAYEKMYDEARAAQAKNVAAKIGK